MTRRSGKLIALRDGIGVYVCDLVEFDDELFIGDGQGRANLTQDDAGGLRDMQFGGR